MYQVDSFTYLSPINYNSPTSNQDLLITLDKATLITDGEEDVARLDFGDAEEPLVAGEALGDEELLAGEEPLAPLSDLVFPLSE